MDATVPEQIAAFFAGRDPVDHLVLALSAAAGGGPFASLDFAELRRGFDGKFWPQVRILQAALPTLRPDGSVVFVTAVSARAARPGTVGLAAINGALEAMIPPLAVELAPLRVNAISPGIVDSGTWGGMGDAKDGFLADTAKRNPAGRVGSPAEVSAAALLVLTNPYVTGTTIHVDGGGRLV